MLKTGYSFEVTPGPDTGFFDGLLDELRSENLQNLRVLQNTPTADSLLRLFAEQDFKNDFPVICRAISQIKSDSVLLDLSRLVHRIAEDFSSLGTIRRRVFTDRRPQLLFQHSEDEEGDIRSVSLFLRVLMALDLIEEKVVSFSYACWSTDPIHENHRLSYFDGGQVMVILEKGIAHSLDKLQWRKLVLSGSFPFLANPLHF